MSENLFVVMRINAAALWNVFVMPEILFGIFRYRGRFGPVNYLVLNMMIAKIAADFALIAAYFGRSFDYVALTCSFYAVFFSLKMTMDLVFTMNCAFYQEFSVKEAVGVVLVMVLAYLIITFYIIFPSLMTFVFPFLVIFYYLVVKLKRKQLKNELTTLADLLFTNGWIDQSNYASSYLKAVPSSSLFYLFHVFETLFFRFEPSENYAFLIFLYEFLFFIENSSLASKFLASDDFLNNPITSQSLLESRRPQIYEISLEESLIINVSRGIVIVTQNNHDVLIGEPIDEYFIYI
jgi:hypothetical protein